MARVKAKPQPKRGPLSKEDKAVIERLRGTNTTEHIAGRLNRHVAIIEHYIRDNPAKEGQGGGYSSDDVPGTVIYDLTTRPEWKQFQARYTDEELEFLKYKYVQLMDQFDDVLPTEEMQIFQVIGLDILIHRTMQEQKLIILELEHLEELLGEAYEAREAGEDNLFKINALESRLSEIRKAMTANTNRHETYLQKQSTILKELKGTRDQRIKIFENSRQSFPGLLRLLDQEDQRQRLGREMELFKYAAEREHDKLTKPHVYGDGVEDYPILTPELIMSEKDKEIEE